MDNHSIRFLLLVLLALALQLLLSWLLLKLGRRAGVQPWQTALLVAASGMLLIQLGRHVLPEQLPICTDSMLHYLQCLGVLA